MEIIMNKKKEYRPFEEAREFVRSLGFKRSVDWQSYCKSGQRPKDIPSNPRKNYEDKWMGMNDWIGSDEYKEKRRRANVYASFEEAREFVRSLGLVGVKEWQNYVKSGAKPDEIPNSPNIAYKEKGWVGVGDWLGTVRKPMERIEFLPFEEAREFMRSLGLKGVKEWSEYRKTSKRPQKIPTAPDIEYKGKGWVGYGDWLGNGKMSKEQFRPFEEAREFVRSLGLLGTKEWKSYCKSGIKPIDIPKYPNSTYEDKGWVGYGDWLGTDNRSGNFLPFEEAREFARSLGLRGQVEWSRYSASGQRPHDIPSAPDAKYKGKGWKDWGDWLGNNRVRYVNLKSFKEARKFARSLKIRNKEEWRRYSSSGQRPDGIPSAPDRIYKEKGWMGYADWLGYKKITRRKKTEGVL